MIIREDVSRFRVVYRRVREAVIIAEAEGVCGGAAAGTGSSGLYKVAVTSMHICARIFAWAWDLLVGSAAYPMQQVSLSSAPSPQFHQCQGCEEGGNGVVGSQRSGNYLCLRAKI